MKKKNIFLFTATLHEAKPILKLSNNISDEIINKVKVRTFEFNNRQIHVIITGVGQKKTKKTLNAIDHFINDGAIINVGAAGSLNNKFRIGEWLTINQLFMSIDDNKFCGQSSQPIKSEIIDDLETASIVTVKKEIKDKETKKELNEKYNADLVDMESFHIAEFARRKNMPCYVIKMVSDNADERTNENSVLNKTMKTHYNSQIAKSFLKVMRECSGR